MTGVSVSESYSLWMIKLIVKMHQIRIQVFKLIGNALMVYTSVKVVSVYPVNRFVMEDITMTYVAVWIYQMREITVNSGSVNLTTGSVGTISNALRLNMCVMARL